VEEEEEEEEEDIDASQREGTLGRGARNRAKSHDYRTADRRGFA
jgi:hypothetical protein